MVPVARRDWMVSGASSSRFRRRRRLVCLHACPMVTGTHHLIRPLVDLSCLRLHWRLQQDFLTAGHFLTRPWSPGSASGIIVKQPEWEHHWTFFLFQ